MGRRWRSPRAMWFVMAAPGGAGAPADGTAKAQRRLVQAACAATTAPTNARHRKASGVLTPSATGKKYHAPPGTTSPSTYAGMAIRLYQTTVRTPVQNSG